MSGTDRESEYGTDQEYQQYQECAEEMLEFIEQSPSSFHAVENVRRMLEAQGFTGLDEREDWAPEAGRGYYVIRNGSSIIAFRLPGEEPENDRSAGNAESAENTGNIKYDKSVESIAERVSGFHIAAAHSDSPAFKVKAVPESPVEHHYVRLNTEKYGGMILSTWLDRALSVAGRIAVRQGDTILTKLVNIDRDLLVIPNLAIHMNREMNKGVEYNPQVDMLPLFAEYDEEKKDGLMRLVAKAAGVEPEDILGHDLFLYVREKGRIIGGAGEFVLSPRLDDLQCAFSIAKAFAESVPECCINVCAIFDNEEVGSGTRQGADSTFLEDTLWRIAESLRLSRSRYLQWIAGSFLISADNGHALHPNHPEKADPANRPCLNGGIVIKYHGSQKYATDALSAARMKEFCRRADVPFQAYANRSDIPGGSTLGNISTAHVSVSSVDIGLAQLAMHSAVETAGVRDTKYAVDMLKAFYQGTISR